MTAGNEVPAGTAGEVVVRGPNVLSEYWNNPKATAEALREGWYYSGDIGVRDADGHFFIHDRKKNLIISGGENIYPAEVERVLGQHPAVADAAVIGRAGRQVAGGARRLHRAARRDAAPDPAEIERFCLAQLARYKVPREYVFVDSLPRNAMGKVQHFRLKELIADGTVKASADAPATEQRADENRRSGRWQWLVGGSR